MTVLFRILQGLAGVAASTIILSGCAINMKVPIKDPVSYSQTFDKTGTPPQTALTFKDAQPPADKAKLLSGRIPMQLTYQNEPFDAVPWIAVQTVREMAARGLPVKLSVGEQNGVGIQIKRIHIENHRVSGFSPFVTFTSLRADIETPQGVQSVTAYVKRGKVPIWSFDEIIDPTYNDPLSIITKELAAKINQKLFHQVVSTEKVNALIAKIHGEAGEADAYLDVYQLGFSNNPAAIPELVKLSSHDSEYVRLAALSSLGILQANDQMGFLIGRYESKDGLWQDRAMALKAIGDMGTPESQAFMQRQWQLYSNKTDSEALWTKEIISLYMNGPAVAQARGGPATAGIYQAPIDPNAQRWSGLMSCDARSDNPARGAYQAKFAMEVSGNSVHVHRELPQVTEMLAGQISHDTLVLQGDGYQNSTPNRKWQFSFSGDFQAGAPIYAAKGSMLAKGKAIRACELSMSPSMSPTAPPQIH